MTKLDDAIEIAVNGGYPSDASTLDGHDFYIRSVKRKGDLAQPNETSYFRHEHPGKDDRVFYEIQLGNKRGEYTAKLTRIQFRGPFTKNGFKPIGQNGIDITDAITVLTTGAAVWAAPGQPANWIAFGAAIAELDLQDFLDGNWVPAAAKVVDMIGARMARDLPG